jgi:hypothetical protein
MIIVAEAPFGKNYLKAVEAYPTPIRVKAIKKI